MSSIKRPGMYNGNSPSFRTNQSSTVGSEVNLREEFDLLVFGDRDNIPHGSLVVVRHMRRDGNGKPQYCTCMEDQIAREPDFDCQHCSGEGYLWDEKWYSCYSMLAGADNGLVRRYLHMPAGQVRIDYKLFFFRYDTPLKYGDKVVEMALDEEGDPTIPYLREAVYKPQTIAKMRSDRGRIEYYAVYCREEDAIRPDVIQ